MKRIVSLLLAAVLAPLILCQSAAAEGVSSSAPPQQNSGSIQKAVVFTLDASNSMNGNDRNRLAIDSIAQLIYSLPSNYVVGVVAYNTDVVAAQGMADSGSRDSIMKAADSVRYTGYTNAGTGLTKALELLDTVEASEKTVVMLSDGEIVMQDDAATAVSSGQFENAVTEAKNSGVVIHVIGLGADMENKANTIFSASAETGGANYHAPRAEDIAGMAPEKMDDWYRALSMLLTSMEHVRFSDCDLRGGQMEQCTTTYTVMENTLAEASDFAILLPNI